MSRDALKYRLTIRLASAFDIEKYEMTDHCNHVDGAAMVWVGGEVAAFINEYNTAKCLPGFEAHQEAIESLVEAFSDIHERLEP